MPGAFIRTNDFPRLTTENTQNGHVYATWQDYRNGEYDIQLAESTDGGTTWSELGTVNPDRGLDHYMPATDESPSNGDRTGVSYYRTDRVPGENTPVAGGFAPCGNAIVYVGGSTTCQPGVGAGNSDYVLSGGTGLASVTGPVPAQQLPTPFDFKVVSPVFPPPDGIQSGFNGDYSGLTIDKGEDAHPIWSDTRNVNLYPSNGVTHDEDVFTDNVGLPNGHANPRARHGRPALRGTGVARAAKAAPATAPLDRLPKSTMLLGVRVAVMLAVALVCPAARPRPAATRRASST